jgi:hypothetical protein|tara:strand:- start:1271 stop:1870 length:600 start_codon:yes stop_codon:yes gene_type:complete
MERKINGIIEESYSSYKQEMKDNILSSLSSINKFIHDNEDKDNDKSETLTTLIESEMMNCLQQLYDYPILRLHKSDFQKRKRVKNIVPLCERCNACRATGEQCTRRKKEGLQFCGTHCKGTPHGVITEDLSSQNITNSKKVNVWAQDIKGIIYYIDDNYNVYDTTTIMLGQENPTIIAKYTKSLDNKGNTKYEIPEFNI